MGKHEPHAVRLREDAEAWREIDGPRLSLDDPFLSGLDEQRAEALVRSNWALIPATAEAAEEFYGDAVDAEAAIADGECPWCDEYDGDAVGQHAASAHPEKWDAYKGA